MKVKNFLNKLMMSSSLDIVRIEQYGYTKEEYDETDLRMKDYGFYGNATVRTFAVHGKTLVINI